MLGIEMVMTMDPHVASCGILWLSFLPLLLIPLTQAQMSATNPAQIVHLPLGAVAGIPCPLNPAVTQYLGLPFAQAPVNDLRFRPPLPYSTRYPTPVLNATRHPPACGNRCGKTPVPEDIKFSAEVRIGDEGMFLVRCNEHCTLICAGKLKCR